MKKSECPQLRNARNPRRNACGQAAAAPPTHRDLGDPREAPRRPAQGSRPAPGPRHAAQRTAAPPVPDSASPPETKGRQQHLQLRHCNHRSGAAVAGTRTRGKEPPLFTAARGNYEIFRSYRSLFSRQLPLPSAARWQRSPLRRLARPPRGRHSRRSPAQPRGALGGKACPGTAGALPASLRVTSWSCRESCVVLSSRPGGLGVLGLWKGACLTERDGAGNPATQGASARGATSTAAASRPGRRPLRQQTATFPCAHRAPVRSRHSPVPARPRPCRQGDAGDAVPAVGSQTSRRNRPPPLSSPVPSRLAL